MLCAIYKSSKKAGMYLYVAKRDCFEDVPEALRLAFGTPVFVMPFNLAGNKPLVRADNREVLHQIRTRGYYLQMPSSEENLLESMKRLKRR